ncbi:MAG: rRNA (cytidine-2'-O-)-methyltransferase, partial [Parcubacteria group bacterium]|nr:rRNA (cytidine-2'-O-)-methyltransferase [Parcubacteria group bacterium]
MYPLYVVSTPIGNLKDITLRALEILREVPVIICEQPSHTLKLLSRYEIRGKEIIQHTEANKRRSIPKIIEVLKEKPALFVTDAGTP